MESSKRPRTYLSKVFRLASFLYIIHMGDAMSATDDILNAEGYAGDFKLGNLPMAPARKLAILACMDARLTVEQVCGLKTGDAHIIRNAGGIATEDALRSLIIP